MLPRFTGEISRCRRAISALKVDGARAYDLARDDEEFELAARRVSIAKLTLIERPDADHCVLEAECGKGTYVRSLARDLGRALGALGHVAASAAHPGRTRSARTRPSPLPRSRRLAESAVDEAL